MGLEDTNVNGSLGRLLNRIESLHEKVDATALETTETRIRLEQFQSSLADGRRKFDDHEARIRASAELLATMAERVDNTREAAREAAKRGGAAWGGMAGVGVAAVLAIAKALYEFLKGGS